jgi:hypothetical protein
MLNLGKAFAIFAVLYLAQPASPASAQTADTVLFNGKILIVDKDFSIKQALAIGHGQILASGTTAEMKKLAGDNAKLIDLGGDSGPDRRAHSRHPRRADLRRRGQLDRRADAQGSTGKNFARPAKPKNPAPGSSWPAAGPKNNSRRSGGRTRPK